MSLQCLNYDQPQNMIMEKTMYVKYIEKTEDRPKYYNRPIKIYTHACTKTHTHTQIFEKL